MSCYCPIWILLDKLHLDALRKCDNCSSDMEQKSSKYYIKKYSDENSIPGPQYNIITTMHFVRNTEMFLESM